MPYATGQPLPPWAAASPPPVTRPPAPRHRGPRAWLVVGLVIVVAVVLGFVLNVANRRPAPDEVVQQYFDALNAGDATAVLALASTPPSDTTFLTSDILKRALPRPITNIVISKATLPSPTTAQVNASYNFLDHPIDTTFTLTKPNKDWLMTRVTRDVDLSSIDGLTPLIGLTFSGTPVPADRKTTTLFPGAYLAEVTGNRLLAVDQAHAGFILADVSAYPMDMSTLQIKLTEEGQRVVGQAAKSKLDACLLNTTSSPDGCGFGISPRLADGTALNLASVAWTVDPASPDVSQLDYTLTDNATAIKVSGFAGLGSITMNAVATDVDGNLYHGSAPIMYATADITDPDHIVITFNSP